MEDCSATMCNQQYTQKKYNKCKGVSLTFYPEKLHNSIYFITIITIVKFLFILYTSLFYETKYSFACNSISTVVLVYQVLGDPLDYVYACHFSSLGISFS